MRLGDLVVRFVADMSGWNTGVKQAQKDIDGTTKSTDNLDYSMKDLKGDLLLASTAIAAAGYAAYSSIQHYGALASQIRDLSYQTGLTTDEVQKLQYTALLSNTDFSRVSFGINNMTLAMEAAKDSTSAEAKAFADLGINPAGKTPAQVFQEVALAISKMKDESRRNADANTILGRSWKEMLPFMQEYVDKKKQIDDSSRYTEAEIKNMQALKTATDESARSLDTWIGKRAAYLGSLNAANEEMNPNKSMLDTWLDNTFGSKSGGRKGAGGRKGEAPASEVVTPSAGFDVSAVIERARTWYDRLLDAQKEYLSVARQIKAEEKETAEIRSDYLDALKTVDYRDTGSVRSLMMGYNKSLSKQKSQTADLQGQLQNSAFKTMAAASGNENAYNSLSLNIENVNLSKEYPLTSFIKDYEKYQAQTNRSMGVDPL